MPRFDIKPIVYISPAKIELFWSHVEKRGHDDCWLWNGGRCKSRYPHFNLGSTKGTERKAHRISFFLANGRDANPLVLHTCDVTQCVNPNHLFEGSNKDNCDDKMRKGRHKFDPNLGQRRRATHPMAKVTEEQVAYIREQYASGVKQAVLARQFNVAHGTIWWIVTGKTWPT